MQRDENLLHINNGQHIDAIYTAFPLDRGGLHPPIRSTGGNSRPDTNQTQS